MSCACHFALSEHGQGLLVVTPRGGRVAQLLIQVAESGQRITFEIPVAALAGQAQRLLLALLRPAVVRQAAAQQAERVEPHPFVEPVG